MSNSVTYIDIVNSIQINQVEKDHSMVEMSHLKYVAFFPNYYKILLSRETINYSSGCKVNLKSMRRFHNL